MNQKNTEFSQDKRLLIQKFITLGELCATISHEMKNLLISINGYCDMIIEKQNNNEPLGDELKEIKKSAVLSKNIFMELLNFSKAGDKSIEKIPSNLNNIIEEILIILGASKKVTFKKNFDPNVKNFMLNPQKIKQVIINIVMNGIDAISGHNGSITLSTGQLSLPFGYFVKISDNGAGMDEEVMKSLFKPFFTTKNHGTGLGLSVCRDIMREHNGSIHVESIIGKGSSFYLMFLFDNLKPHHDIIDL